jgi:serine/threonine protein phosphatase 1
MMAARTFVIGDIHGCAEEVDRLLDALRPGRADTLCFLGDYIDRGPSSKGVVERLIRLRTEGPTCVFLKGNHEDMFLSYMGFPGRYGEAFVANGGAATLASYGLQSCSAALAAERLPAAHMEFLHSLCTQVQFGRFLCVHAGVRPSRPLDRQTEEDLLWIREEFLEQPHRFPVTVLFGHTPQREVRLHLPFKIGLDTGLVYGHRLSCLELERAHLWQIGRGSNTILERSLAADFARAGIQPDLTCP